MASSKMIKEIEKLKKENKKLRKALKQEGIEPDDILGKKLGKKLGDILTGEELRIAAEKGLKVRYVVTFYNPEDRHYNFNKDCIMEKTSGNDEYYYIGDSDICLGNYRSDEKVTDDFDEGHFQVRKAKGVKYI